MMPDPDWLQDQLIPASDRRLWLKSKLRPAITDHSLLPPAWTALKTDRREDRSLSRPDLSLMTDRMLLIAVRLGYRFIINPGKMR